MGGIMANSSLSLTMAESVVYSSFKATTMQLLISCKPGKLVIILLKQSRAVLPDGTSNGVSVKPQKKPYQEDDARGLQSHQEKAHKPSLKTPVLWSSREINDPAGSSTAANSSSHRLVAIVWKKELTKTKEKEGAGKVRWRDKRYRLLVLSLGPISFSS
uniref:Uncharacterized protein n=1 Tax=Cannabis sativa TaxID=3483 RepID=A0A803PS54_CANSA